MRGCLELIRFSEDQQTTFFKLEIKPPLAINTNNAAFDKCDIQMRRKHGSVNNEDSWEPMKTISGHGSEERGEFRENKPVTINLERKTPLKWLNTKIELKAHVHYRGGRLEADSNVIDLDLTLPNLRKLLNFIEGHIFVIFNSDLRPINRILYAIGGLSGGSFSLQKFLVINEQRFLK